MRQRYKYIGILFSALLAVFALVSQKWGLAMLLTVTAGLQYVLPFGRNTSVTAVQTLAQRLANARQLAWPEIQSNVHANNASAETIDAYVSASWISVSDDDAHSRGWFQQRTVLFCDEVESTEWRSLVVGLRHQRLKRSSWYQSAVTSDSSGSLLRDLQRK